MRGFWNGVLGDAATIGGGRRRRRREVFRKDSEVMTVSSGGFEYCKSMKGEG